MTRRRAEPWIARRTITNATMVASGIRFGRIRMARLVTAPAAAADAMPPVSAHRNASVQAVAAGMSLIGKTSPIKKGGLDAIITAAIRPPHGVDRRAASRYVAQTRTAAQIGTT